MQSGAIFIYSFNEEDKREKEKGKVTEEGRREKLVAIWREATSA